MSDEEEHSRGSTPYNGLYGEAPPERGTFFRLQVYKRVGISQGIWKGRKIFIRVLKRALNLNISNRITLLLFHFNLLREKKDKKTSYLTIYS